MIEAPSLPGRRWPCVRSYEPWQLYLELCRTERLDPQVVGVLQQRQLRELLRYAREFVPYYRQTFDGIAEDAPLEAFPILSRRDIQCCRREELTPRRLPAGLRLAGTIRTSGSTGEPVVVNYTQARSAWYAAHMLRYLDWIGVDQSRTLAAIRHVTDMPDEMRAELANGVECSSWDAALLGLIETGPGHVLSIDQDPRVQYQWLKRVQPQYLVSHPSNLQRLSELARAHGAPGTLERIISFGEAITEEQRDDIRDGLCAPVYDIYSCRELGVLASECGACGLYHVHAENVILEVVDDDGTPCKPGETGRVVLTGLTSFAMPLVRYDIGDRARLPVKAAWCPRVRGLPSLVSIEGRTLPPLLVGGGQRRDPMALVAALNGLSTKLGILQFSVTQTAADEVVIDAVIRPNSHRAAVGTALVAAALRFFETDAVHVDLDLGEKPLLTDAGKAPPVVKCLI